MPRYQPVPGLLCGGDVVEAEILKMAASQGFFAVLFTGLFIYVLKNNKEREDKLMECLNTLGKQYESLSKDMGVIKDDIRSIKQKGVA